MVFVVQSRLVRGISATVVVALLVTCAGLTLAYEPPQLGAGSIEEAASSKTAVAIQGFHFQGKGNTKKPARLLMVNETGTITELYDGSQSGARWFYDVDPLADGTLLVTTTNPPRRGPPGGTMVYEFDPETREVVWKQPFDAVDTHDVDLLNEHELIVANMRNGGENGSGSADRLFIYNLTTDEVVWEWTFRNHYPASTAGGASGDDWTHVNDVDEIEEGRFLVSPRNFDQVIVVNRSTKDIEMRLGADDDHDVLDEQHNPDYLTGPDGTPTVLVADSGNDRVVEYARDCGDADPRLGAGTPPEDCEWDLVWELGGRNLNWPRDADRLPNGNTLVVDSLNHRVIEVTPRGKVVWETFTPWGPYDAERVRYGDGSNGPTMQEQGVTGSYALTCPSVGNAGEGSSTGQNETGASRTAAEATETGTTSCDIDYRMSFPTWLKQTSQGLPFSGTIREFAEVWEGVSQWIKPVWMAPWGFVALVAALVVSTVWGVGELVYRRRRIYDRVASLRARASSDN